ncbi:MAG TPA: ABC transporter ATP-binding protein [Acetobacteraceae bacterium]|nr:ABC transporter ATP-binding protein [Acetobacteraceae bacterium]
MAIVSRDFRALRLDRVSRDFGQTHALRDVSLTVQRGEFVALLGPSGCGKSTALNCIAGLLQPTGGEIWLDEQRVDEIGPEDRGFGMVFQNYALFPHMTVRRNIGFGLVTQRRPKAEIVQRVEEALALVRLQQHGDKLPGQLSGGQQQRVAIARAIVVAPPLVLMDEPLSNLDAKLRLEMRAEIRRIHGMLGSATIYVTHDQEEALSLADRIAVLIDGRPRQIGTPEELYRAPADADVAEFMGYRNLVRSPVEAADAGVAVRIAGARVAGTPIGVVGAAAVVAIRPDDLHPAGDGPIEAVVEIAEYHGRDFYTVGRGADGTELFFRSAVRVQAGETVRLMAAKERVLVYPAPSRHYEERSDEATPVE